MNDKLFLSFGKNCHQKCKPSVFAEIEQHQKSTNLEHLGMQLSKYHQKYRKFNETLSKLTEGLIQLKRTIESETQQIISRVNKLRDQLVQSIDVQINRYYIADRSSHHLKKEMIDIEQQEFTHVTCHQLREIIKIFDKTLKEPSFLGRQTNQIKNVKNRIENQFSKRVQSILQTHKSAKSQHQDIFTANQSTISQKSSDLTSNKYESILDQLKCQSREQKESKNTKKRYKKVESNSYSGMIIESDHQDDENVYTQKTQFNPNMPKLKRELQKKEEGKEVKRESSCIEVGSKLREKNSSLGSVSSLLKSVSSGHRGSQISSSISSITSVHPKSQSNAASDDGISSIINSQEWESEGDENEEKMNETVLLIQDQVKNTDKKETSPYYTIEQLEKKNILLQSFSLKVKIIKLLYYSVVEKHIPKLKFIAGDSTGYGLFFTNYCPGMKVGTCLALFDCTYNLYKGSLQIRNDHNFSILTQHSISVNMKGVRLNKVITSDLYYPLIDHRCFLIRQLAEKLKKDEKIPIFRMFVKVIVIIYEQGTRVFCQVGDSSGLMLAYLKTSSRLKSIREGDVVRLLRVKGCRGMEKANKKQFGKQIIYIDCEHQKAKVLPHGFDFLEVSNDIMALD